MNTKIKILKRNSESEISKVLYIETGFIPVLYIKEALASEQENESCNYKIKIQDTFGTVYSFKGSLESCKNIVALLIAKYNI